MSIPKERKGQQSVLQPWVEEIGLRYQGVLMGAIRGCDTAPKNDPSKLLTRCFRNEVLKSFTEDPKQSASFIEAVEPHELGERMKNFLRNWDHYPMHFVMHFVHAAEVVGRFHSDPIQRDIWNAFYEEACRKMHMTPESTATLRARLEANEQQFEQGQREGIDVDAIMKRHALRVENEMMGRCQDCGNKPCNCRWAGT